MMAEQEKVEQRETIEQVEVTEQQPDPQSGMDVKAELERTRKALAQANREAAERRVKLQEFEAAEQKRREAEMSELEKAQAAAAKAEADLQAAKQQADAMVLRSAIVSQAAVLEFADPMDAFAMLDKSGLIVEGGEVKGVEEALKALAESKPYLLKAATKPPKLNPSNPGGGNENTENDAERRRRLGLA